MSVDARIKAIKAIIDKHEISCGEDIYQSDRVIENALQIIEAICEIVGYYKKKESRPYEDIARECGLRE